MSGPMEIVAVRRYPVKSMGGEALDAVALDARGLEGDRWFAVQDEDGRLASGKHTKRFRRYDQVFAYVATTGESGEVAVADGSGEWTVGDPALDQSLSDAFGTSVRVTPEAAEPHQDAGSVSLVGTATLEWCAERWGIDADPRRLRVNLVISTDEPFIEEGWVGRSIAVGGAVLRGVQRNARCRTIDLDQDGAVADGRWLKPLTAERDGCVALYADVEAPGLVRLGDQVMVE